MITPRIFSFALVLAVAAQVLTVPVRAAVNVTSIASFGDAPAPASPFYGHLLDNGAGSFYGLSSGGGANGAGAVFRVTSAGLVTTLVSFNDTDVPLGSQPIGSLIRASDGLFYGMTRSGGANGKGTLFRVNSSGTLETLVEFGGADAPLGSFPTGSLVAGPGGLYGMTTAGGSSDLGTIFKITLAGVLSTLVEFDDDTVPGSAPHGSLFLGSDGNFYGMARDGGTHGFGTIFKLTSAGALTTLVHFNNDAAPLGAAPYGSLVEGAAGTFYGMTSAGGAGDFGTVFKVTSGGVLTTLVDFANDGTPAGATPYGSLVFGSDGNLYGLTYFAGANSIGLLFKMTTAGVITTVVEFDDSTLPGAYPAGSLMAASDGFLYGMTSGGGTHGNGTVFKLDINVAAPEPEIGVFDNNLVTLVDGVSSVGFGGVDVGSSDTITLTITNSGTASLTGLTITITGTDAAMFQVTANPSAPLASHTATTFDLQFSPGSAGFKGAVLHIASNDSDEASFDISLTGSGITPGAALAFDGSNDGVSLGDAAALRFDRTSAFTIELWYKPFSSGVQSLVSKLNPASPFPGYEIFLQSGQVYVQLISNYPANNLIVVGSVAAPSFAVWHHLAVTYDGSSAASGIKMYVDGVAQTLSVSQNNLTGSFTAPGVSAYLGSRQNASFPFNGNMDEVRFWSRALDQCEIQYQRDTELAGDEPGLVAYYQFNEGSAQVDNSGVTLLPSIVTGGPDGTLQNFALNGTTGNWTTPGGVVSGSSKAAYTAPEVGLLGGAPLVAIAKGDTTPGTADGTDFGSLLVGATPIQRTFSITNSGTSDLVVSAISKSGAHTADFTLGNPILPATIVPGAATNFTVTFSPVVGGVRTATISIVNTDCDEALYDFAVTGTGLAPEIAVQQPAGVEIADGGGKGFGSVAVGLTTNITFTITNSGTANLTGLAITIDGTDASMFTVTGQPSAPLAANASTTFTVEFAPTAQGGRGANLHIASNDGDENPYDISLSGTALPPAPEIAVFSHDFGTEILKSDTTPVAEKGTHFQAVTLSGTGSAVLRTYLITNSGNAALNLTSMTVSGANPGDFTVSGFTPGTIPAKSGTLVSVTFDATAIGVRKATVTIANNDGDEGSFDFALEGAGSLTISTIHNFPFGGTDVTRPHYTDLLQTSDGMLYGVTEFGGLNGNGTVFKADTNGTVTLIASFTGNSGATRGANPYGGLAVGLDGLLYGTTSGGGSGGGNGTIFKVTTNGTFTTLVDFTGASGGSLGLSPVGRLVRSADGVFYGSTYYGGTLGFGTLFKVNSNGVMTTLVQFTGNTGARLGGNPWGPLAFGTDGLLYGMASDDTVNNRFGTIFRVDTNGGNYTVLASFTGQGGAIRGAFPYGGLTLGSDGLFYGTTGGDYVNFHGTVFRISTNGVFAHLTDLSGQYGTTRGRYATGTLVKGPGGVLYGLASEGGYYNNGTLFQVTTGGAFTNLVDFGEPSVTFNQGSGVTGSLIVGLDGLLYGVTDLGGSFGSGTIFKLNVSSVTPPTIIPTLSVILSGGNALVRWPVAGTSEFTLEQTTTVASPTSWSAVSGGNITSDGTTNTATIPATGLRFLRLKKP